MSIDDVIARSRQPGTFSERRRFSVARSRAIRKMRQFALADPSYYVLEWIQSAIANGATYIDLAIGPTDARMSYVDGGFTRAELSALFDFLFASKDNLDVADVRLLALGVNALLLAEPKSIVIESGDGTLQGTTRIEIEGRSDSVYVGTPTAPLAGTFVRAEGLRRQFGELKELRAIEERCLTAPVPILVNGDALFGYTSIRSPDLFGYRSRLKFDEGDLYGTIGLATTGITRTVKLLTWGVWVGSTRSPWEDLPPIGGVVGYDRLRKTADHANVVHDEIFQQMWARLEPYARQLASGETGRATFDIRRLDGSTIDAVTFRTEATRAGGAVVFSTPTDRRQRGFQGDDLAIATGFGEVFDAPVFLVGRRDQETVRHLLGPGLEVWTPSLTEADLAFFRRPPTGHPPRPWLTAMEDLGEVALEELPADTPGTVLRGCRRVSVRVYTPREYQPGTALRVELHNAQRLLTSVALPSSFPGHVVVVDLEGPIAREGVGEHARQLAEIFAGWAEPHLGAVVTRVLESLRADEVSSANASRVIALAALARSTVLRFRSCGTGGWTARFAVFDEAVPETLLELPILPTASGELHSLRDLERTLGRTMGLLHISRARPNETLGSELDECVYLVDAVTGPLLEALVGDAAVVEVRDGRPLASTAATGVQFVIRDALVGIEAAPDKMLLTQGSEVPPAEVVTELVHQLSSLIESPTTPTGVRRAAGRHLLWYAAQSWRRREAGGDSSSSDAALALKLFRTAGGELVSMAEVGERLRSPEGLQMLDGWAVDPCSPGVVDLDEGVEDYTLACNPFVFDVLGRIGTVTPALDVDLSVGEARANDATPSTAFLESREISDPPLVGRIGFPMVDTGVRGVLLTDQGRRRARLFRDIAREVGGVVGHLRYRGEIVSREAVESACVEASMDMLVSLIGRVAGLSPGSAEYDRALEILLGFAEEHIQITSKDDGSYSYSVFNVTAARILELPIFPTADGVSATGARLLREFTAFGDREPHIGRTILSDDIHPTLSAWLDRVLAIDAAVPTPTMETHAWTSFADWLTVTLATLRPSGDDLDVKIRILPRHEVQRMTPKGSNVLASGMVLVDDLLLVSDDFWLLEGTLDAEGRPRTERTAWLLLALYAFANESRLGVTNFHEIQFQSRVLDWLATRQAER